MATLDTLDLLRYNTPTPRYTSYPTAREFRALEPACYREHLHQASASRDPISLYVHIPFCESRCLYCACHTVILQRRFEAIAETYASTIASEARLIAHHLSDRRELAQLHLGGGTPTYLEAQVLDALLTSILSDFELLPSAEAAVEVDPRVTRREHLEVLARHRFRRISLGVQDLDPQVQQTIGRIQPLQMTQDTIEQARSLGFRSVNIDLIYGLPHQDLTSLTPTLDRVINLRPDRIALYSFAFLPGMIGHHKKLPAHAILEGRRKLELFLYATEKLTAAGYRFIGMDHFALPDDDLCRAQDDGRLTRNFMGYTSRAADDLVGLGLSAIGSVAGCYAQNQRKLKPYRERVEAGVLPTHRGTVMRGDDEVRAAIIQDLMCHFRLIPSHIEERFDLHFETTFASELERLEGLLDKGLLELRHDRSYHATDLGRFLIRNIARIFDAYRPQSATETGFSKAI